MAESALIVPVPESESLVSSWRDRFDPVARQGVPAHITILYPFVPPDQIDKVIIDKLRAALQSSNSFGFALSEVARFPNTVYLAPHPATPFIELTSRMVEAFPDYPPYGGQFPSIIPHLTVAHSQTDELFAIQQALAADLAATGHIVARCAALSLIDNSSGQWRERQNLPLLP